MARLGSFDIGAFGPTAFDVDLNAGGVFDRDLIPILAVPPVPPPVPPSPPVFIGAVNSAGWGAPALRYVPPPCDDREPGNECTPEEKLEELVEEVRRKLDGETLEVKGPAAPAAPVVEAPPAPTLTDAAVPEAVPAAPEPQAHLAPDAPLPPPVVRLERPVGAPPAPAGGLLKMLAVAIGGVALGEVGRKGSKAPRAAKSTAAKLVGPLAPAAEKTLMGHRCRQCDYEWVPRGAWLKYRESGGDQSPRLCPRCSSIYW